MGAITVPVLRWASLQAASRRGELNLDYEARWSGAGCSESRAAVGSTRQKEHRKVEYERRGCVLGAALGSHERQHHNSELSVSLSRIFVAPLCPYLRQRSQQWVIT